MDKVGFDESDRIVEVAGIYFEKVHSDERRTIYANNELLNGKEISLIKLNPGKAIGGCVHKKDDERFVILKGKVQIWDGSIKYYGMQGTFEKNTPHAFYNNSNEVALIMEFGTSPDDKNTHDEYMRKEVNMLNNSVNLSD